MNKKLTLYMILINITPFLLYDRLVYHSLSALKSPLLVFLLTNTLSKFILFLLIYGFIQTVLFKTVLMRLYHQDHVSAYGA